MDRSSSTSRSYHHGDLRATLIRHALALLAEKGIAGFSVAQVAKRAEVSSAAPYRHFADRRSLLAACATVIAGDLAADLAAAASSGGDDPVEVFAAIAGSYARFVVTHGVGMDLIYADGFTNPAFTELHEQSRRLVDVLFSATERVSASASFETVAELSEAQIAMAHGFATLQRGGGFAQFHRSIDDIEHLASAAARHLVDGRRH